MDIPKRLCINCNPRTSDGSFGCQDSGALFGTSSTHESTIPVAVPSAAVPCQCRRHWTPVKGQKLRRCTFLFTSAGQAHSRPSPSVVPPLLCPQQAVQRWAPALRLCAEVVLDGSTPLSGSDWAACCATASRGRASARKGWEARANRATRPGTAHHRTPRRALLKT